jgi:ADP-ribose pyrophosphatase YjhB (NUDIX family)
MSIPHKHLHEIAQPIFTVDICIIHQGKILLFKRSETKKIFPGWWTFPGGHIDDGENPLSAAIRETKEETGIIITPDIIQLKFIAMHHHIDRHELYIVFGFRVNLENNPISIEPSNEGTAQWIDLYVVPTIEHIFPPVQYYIDHITHNRTGIMYNNSIWNNSQLVKVECESVDRNF